ncbi:AraC family transcriptional regulator [Prosthecobacter sp.]|uniref:AraC family transcriptional regulator n=1 Tax=Prosthecobacter sp. TaxID=1965333 RepID=UPI0025F9519A|nr:AraC family transcriptional regulator [Prosthecobacter sp.]
MSSRPSRPENSAALRERFIRRVSADTPFYRLFDHLPDLAFFAKDSEFRFMCASRRFMDRFGISDESDIVGKNDFDLFPARLAENFRRDDEELLQTGKPKLNIVELFFTDQGIPDWFVTNKLPLLDAKGRLIGIMGTVQSFEGKKQVLQPYLQIDRALAYIREHFRTGVSITELAQIVHLSPRQLHRKFVETFGASPQAFIMKLRIQAACEALQKEGAQITEVAQELGFCDQSAFTHHFHRHMGMTPLKYLRQFRLVRRS